MKDGAAFNYLATSTGPPRVRWNRRTPTFHESRSIVCARGRGAQPCYPAEIQHQRCSRLNSVNTAGHQGPKSTASRRPRSSPAEETAEYHFVEGERQFQDLLKTGRWRDAPAVFDGLRQEGCHLNLRTYRACMAVMAEHGKGEEAMRYLQQMENAGVVADSSTLGHVSVACARGGDLDSALIILRGMVAKRMSAARTFNLVLLAIANGRTSPSPLKMHRKTRADGRFRRGPLSNRECDRAVALVEEMRAVGVSPTKLTYNVLIAALARSRRPEEELLALLEEMREQGLAPDSYTFVGVLKGLVGENRFVRARQLLEDAKQDLDGFGLSSVYSAVISGCGAKARWEEVVDLIKEMQELSVPRDEYTYCAAMNVCKEAGKWETAVSLIRQMEDDGVAPNLVAYNTVIGACAFFGRPSKPWDSKLGAGVPRQQPAHSGHLTEVQREAIRAGDVALTLLDEMVESGLKPDVITFGALMSALSPRGSSGADDVLKIFDALLEAKIEPNTITYVSVIRAWGDKGDWRKAEQMITEMNATHDLAPNRFCYAAVIKALANGGQWERALEKLDEMRQLGMTPDAVVYTSAIGACEKFGKWEEALDTLGKLIAENPPRHTLRWGYNAAVSALGKARQLEGAKDLVETMKANGIKPDQYTYACLMRVSGMVGSWEEALSMLDEMDRADVAPNHVVYNTLVASLAKAEKYEQIMAILVRMRSTGVQPDVTTYTAMLAGCKRSADWIRAESLVSDMQAYGVKPNSRTTTAMLKIYGDAGEVERAEALFEDWAEQGVKIDVYCYNALMGAMLKNGRYNKVFELYEELRSRKYKPDNVTHSLMLNAAEQTGNVDWVYRLVKELRANGQVPSMQVYSDAIRACCGNTSDGMVDGFETDVEVGEERNALPGGRGYATSDEGHAIGLETQGSTARVPTVGVESAGLEFIAGQAPLRRALDVFAEARKHYPGDDGGRLYTSILTACARQGGVGGADAARLLIAEMRSLAVPPDGGCFSPAASALAAGGDWEGAVEILRDGAAVGFGPDEISCDKVRRVADAEGSLGLANERLAHINIPFVPDPREDYSQRGVAGHVDTTLAMPPSNEAGASRAT